MPVISREKKRCVEKFHTQVNLLLTDREKHILFGLLKHYYKERMVRPLVDGLVRLLSSPDKLDVIVHIRNILPSCHVSEFDFYMRHFCAPVGGSPPRSREGSRAISPSGHSVQSYASSGRNHAPSGEKLIIQITRDKSTGVGFSVRGGSEHGLGLYVSHVKPGSPSDDGGLEVGDKILEVNNISLEDVASSGAIMVLTGSTHLKLVVERTGQVPEWRMAHEKIVWVDSNTKTVISGNFEDGGNHSFIRGLDVDIPERRVTLSRNKKSAFGFNIRGGSEYGLGIYVSSMDKKGLAEKNGIKVGDQIIDVNGIPFDHVSHQDAVEVIANQHHLILTVRDVGRFPVYKELYAEYTWIVHNTGVYTKNSDLFHGTKQSKLQDLWIETEDSKIHSGLILQIPGSSDLYSGHHLSENYLKTEMYLPKTSREQNAMKRHENEVCEGVMNPVYIPGDSDDNSSLSSVSLESGVHGDYNLMDKFTPSNAKHRSELPGRYKKKCFKDKSVDSFKEDGSIEILDRRKVYEVDSDSSGTVYYADVHMPLSGMNRTDTDEAVVILNHHEMLDSETQDYGLIVNQNIEPDSDDYSGDDIKDKEDTQLYSVVKCKNGKNVEELIHLEDVDKLDAKKDIQLTQSYDTKSTHENTEFDQVEDAKKSTDGLLLYGKDEIPLKKQKSYNLLFDLSIGKDKSESNDNTDKTYDQNLTEFNPKLITNKSVYSSEFEQRKYHHDIDSEFFPEELTVLQNFDEKIVSDDTLPESSTIEMSDLNSKDKQTNNTMTSTAFQSDTDSVLKRWNDVKEKMKGSLKVSKMCRQNITKLEDVPWDLKTRLKSNQKSIWNYECMEQLQDKFEFCLDEEERTSIIQCVEEYHQKHDPDCLAQAIIPLLDQPEKVILLKEIRSVLYAGDREQFDGTVESYEVRAYEELSSKLHSQLNHATIRSKIKKPRKRLLLTQVDDRGHFFIKPIAKQLDQKAEENTSTSVKHPESVKTDETRENEVMAVVYKTEATLGLCISGGSNSRRQPEIRVDKVLPGGCVAKEQIVQPGMVILAVGNTNLEKATHEEAVEALGKAFSDKSTDSLTLTLKCDEFTGQPK